MATNFLLTESTPYFRHSESPKRHEIFSCFESRIGSRLLSVEWINNCRNCFGFFHMFEANYFTKYATDLRDIFRIEMWLRSLKGRCHGNRFIFTHSTQFFRHSDQCVINSSTGSMVVKSTWTISVDNTYTPRNGRFPPGNGHFPFGHFSPPQTFP